MASSLVSEDSALLQRCGAGLATALVSSKTSDQFLLPSLIWRGVSRHFQCLVRVKWVSTLWTLWLYAFWRMSVFRSIWAVEGAGRARQVVSFLEWIFEKIIVIAFITPNFCFTYYHVIFESQFCYDRTICSAMWMISSAWSSVGRTALHLRRKCGSANVIGVISSLTLSSESLKWHTQFIFGLAWL